MTVVWFGYIAQTHTAGRGQLFVSQSEYYLSPRLQVKGGGGDRSGVLNSFKKYEITLLLYVFLTLCYKPITLLDINDISLVSATGRDTAALQLCCPCVTHSHIL